MNSNDSEISNARDRLRERAQNESTYFAISGLIKCAQDEILKLREENERLRNNVLVLGDNQQPVAEYDGVEFSRYTLRWINGVMPVGTKLYALPVFDVQAEKNRHDAEELEALHMNLRDNNVPTHDENGEPFSAWGRVLWFAEKRNAIDAARGGK